MSSIGSIGGSSSDLFQFLQSIGSAGIQPAASTSSTDPASATSNLAQASQFSTGGTHHHHHHGGGGQVFQQIQQAVTSALQGAQSNGSTTDPNQTIEDAISQVLKNLGVGSSSGASSANPTDPNGDGNSAGAAASNTPGSSQTPAAAGSAPAANSKQAFFQLLQSAGVNPQQFFQDFSTAIQQAQNGNVNPASALQSLPPGSIVDTIG